MIKSPIQEVTNKLQYRAIGIFYGIYNPNNEDHLNRGTLTDNQGKEIETVVLGKALPLIRKHINLKKSYFWIVYPKNKNTQNLHLQIAGIWDPYQLNDISNDNSRKNNIELLEEFNLNENYFSVRGELVFVNTKKNEFVIKISSSHRSNKFKNNNFKLVIEGEMSLELLNKFLSLDVIRYGSILRMTKYEVIEDSLFKK